MSVDRRLIYVDLKTLRTFLNLKLRMKLVLARFSFNLFAFDLIWFK